jgi:hypothetical protein
MAGNKDSAPVAVRRITKDGETIISWFPNSLIAQIWVEAYNADNTTGFAEIVIEDDQLTWGIDMDDLARREKTSTAVGCLTNEERAYLLQYRYFLVLRSGCVVDPLMKKSNRSDIQVIYDVGSH